MRPRPPGAARCRPWGAGDRANLVRTWRRDVFSAVARQVSWPTEPVFKRGRTETHRDVACLRVPHHYANSFLRDLDPAIDPVVGAPLNLARHRICDARR